MSGGRYRAFVLGGICCRAYEGLCGQLGEQILADYMAAINLLSILEGSQDTDADCAG